MDLTEHLDASLKDRDRALPVLASREGSHVISFSQTQVLRAPDVNRLSFVGAVRVRGILNEDRFERALWRLGARHEPLRTTFPRGAGEVPQTVNRSGSLDLRVIDAGAAASLTETESLREWLTASRQDAFDLERGPLFRWIVVRGTREYVLIVASHPLVADCASFSALWRDLSVFMGGGTGSQDPVLPPLAAQYIDFAAWQRARVNGGAVDGYRQLWRSELQEGGLVHASAVDQRRPGLKREFTLSDADARGLSQAAAAVKGTITAGIVAGLAAFFGREHGFAFCAGIVTTGRVLAATESMVGNFVSMPPVSVALDPDATFVDAIGRAQAAMLRTRPWQEAWPAVSAELRDRRPSVGLNFLPPERGLSRFGDDAAEALEVDPDQEASIPIGVRVRRVARGFNIQLRLRTDLFDAAVADQIAKGLETTLTRAAQSPLASVRECVRAAPLTGRVLSPQRAPRQQAPSNAVEAVLCAVTREVLGIEEVGVQDNILGLGANSLSVLRIVQRAADEGLAMTAAQIFDSPSIADLAQVAQWGGSPSDDAAGATTGPVALLPAQRDLLRLRGPQIETVSRNGPLRASFAEERLCFLDRLDPGQATYNVAEAFRLKGALDVVALGRALEGLAARHESLRTCFQSDAGVARRVVAGAVEVALRREVLAGESEEELRAWVSSEARRPFDLSRGPLWRAALAELGGEEHLFVLTVHHIVTDGASQGILLGELAQLYAAFREGKAPRLLPLKLAYADYAEWQRKRLAGGTLQSELAFWERELSGVPPLELPTDKPRPPVQSQRGEVYAFDVAPEIYQPLKGLGLRLGATPFMTLLAAFEVLLLRHTGQKDFGVGAPVGWRTRADLEGLVGFFVNTLCLRANLSGRPGFEDLLRRVKESALKAYAHQEVPFEKVVEVLQPKRDVSRPPVFQVMFSLENFAPVTLQLEGMEVERYLLQMTTSQFDLTLFARETKEGLACGFEYCTDVFEKTTVERLARHYQALLRSIVDNPATRVDELEFLSDEERRRLWAWQSPSAPAPAQGLLHELFEKSAAQNPSATALTSGARSVTYGELEKRARRLAHRLRQEMKVRPGDRVGVFLERGIEAVVALLGVLKSGAAFVPLEPSLPDKRLGWIVEDAALSGVVTEERLRSRLPAGTRWIAVEALDGLDDVQPQTTRLSLPASSAAYLIYTSGSTGQPKGVLVEHRNIRHYIEQAVLEYRHSEADRILQVTSFSFDVAMEDIFTTLASGAALVLSDAKALGSASAFLSTCRDLAVTVLSLPTAYWHEVSAGLETPLPPSIRLCIIGGEQARADRLAQWQRFAGGTRLVNSYGPTEATVGATWWEAAGVENEEPAIGRPVPGVSACVLDAYLKPVPTGVAGELYLGGAGVARGYWGRPAHTAERFVPDPFSSRPGSRMYRTGDVARWGANGSLHYLGRKDDQVKIRGFRIELGEVEEVLSRQSGVSDAAVVVGTGSSGEARLVAYWVPARQGATTVDALRAAVGRELPAYMVPSAFVELERLPLTPNGKVDRKALPSPAASTLAAATFEAPRTPTEEVLCSLWGQVLGVERVGTQDDFFALGGHSLLAMQMVAKAEQAFAVGLSVRLLFEAPALTGFAAKVDEALQLQAQGQSSLSAVQRVEARDRGRWPEGELVLAFPEERGYRVWRRFAPEGIGFPVFDARLLEGPLDVAALEEAVNVFLSRHDVLWCQYWEEAGDVRKRLLPFRRVALQRRDMTGLPLAQRLDAMREDMAKNVRAGDALEEAPPLFRVILYALGDARHGVLVATSHVVFDAASLGIFWREVAETYAGRPGEGPRPVQYADFAVWQRTLHQGAWLEEQVAYWKRRLSGAEPLSRLLPTDFPREEVDAARAKDYLRPYPTAAVSVELDRGFVQRLKALAAAERMPFSALLYAAYAAVLGKHAKTEDVVLSHANDVRRRVAGLSETVGFFTNSILLRLDLSGCGSVREVLVRARKEVLTALSLPEFQLIPFVFPRLPDFSRVLFNYEGSQSAWELPGLAASGIDFRRQRTTKDASQLDLALHVRETATGGLLGFLLYNTALWRQETVGEWVNEWQHFLAAAARSSKTA